MNYKKSQYMRVESLIKNSNIFNGDIGNGEFGGTLYTFVLSNYNNNLYAPVRHDILEYFVRNKISWWRGKPTNHPLSSQISCLNHLFPIREDKEIVLSLVKSFYQDMDKVLPILTDKYKPAYIQFEAISDTDYLNESKSSRGRNCTSIDALVYGQNSDGKKILVLIEWKYVEAYGNINKASGESGETRKKRYTDLIDNSVQLIGANHSNFYYEPFYQLMRQTIWAEQMIINREKETLKADDFIHIHVIPKGNSTLLNKKYFFSGKNMEETWRSLIKDQNKYLIISLQELFKPLSSLKKYLPLVEYLQERYW